MVYAELIFADNFAADILIMALALHMSHTKVRIWRLLLSGAIGGTYAVAAVLWEPALLLPIKIAVGAAMCAVHGVRPMRRFAANMGIFFAISFCAAGAAMLIGTSSGNYISFNGPAIRYAAFAGMAGVLIFETVNRCTYPSAGKVYEIEANFGTNTVRLNAVLDTGNMLEDVSGRGVIIADKQSLLAQIGGLDGFDVEFKVLTAAGKCVLKAKMPDELSVKSEGVRYSAKAYICTAENIRCKNADALLSPKVRLKKIGEVRKHDVKTDNSAKQIKNMFYRICGRK